MANLPQKADIVIIGGGVIGCSIAYHLTKAGRDDVVLLERRKLTSGTTWHAAGLIGQLRAGRSLTWIARYTAELLEELERETGQATGYKRNGSLTLAANHERLEEVKRLIDIAAYVDVEARIVDVDEIRELYPLIDTSDLVGGAFIPRDGQANPADVTQAYAKGARMGGARILEDTAALDVTFSGNRATGVVTNKGAIEANTVVMATGMWGLAFARQLGLTVPLHPCGHYYIVTEPFEGVEPTLPVLRDVDNHSYWKEDAGKIMIGCFELHAKPWAEDGIPDTFEFDELPAEFDHFEPILEKALERMPALENAGVQTFFCGPESFGPDGHPNLGPLPGTEGLYVAAGLNSIGIISSGGVGRAMADWISKGHPTVDLWESNVARHQPFMGNRKFAAARAAETLAWTYDTHWPFKQRETARGLRRSALHEHLRRAGACFGETHGWERANWFGEAGSAPAYEYSWGRQNWFEASASEHRAAREGCALFDLSSFVKLIVEGPDALALLNRVSSADIDVAVGRAVYTPWLNERGGIEADLTITRLSAARFMIVTGVASQTKDVDWLRRHTLEGERVVITDATSGLAVIGLTGPESRDVAARLTPDDLSNEALKFGWSMETELGFVKGRVTRLSYAGELGFEIYVGTEFAAHVYEQIIDAAGDQITHAGMHALNSLRLEKGFRHFGHDITDEDTVLEAGMGFAVKLDKPGGFIGRDSVLRQKEEGLERHLVSVLMKDSEPLLYHNEPIRLGGETVGYITSGMYGHTLGASVGLGYVNVSGPVAASDGFQVRVAGEDLPAEVSPQAFYDPPGARMRG